ncbi:MAG: endolytic transglycosylase MltG [Synergistales bacterium]|nr:endolytic transglycosylase MltG [Synergistales bacterium]
MFQKFLEWIIFLLSAAYFIYMVTLSTLWYEARFELGIGPEMIVVITPGQSAMEVAEHFFSEGLVTDASQFSHWMVKMGIDRKIQPGSYKLRKGSPWEVAKQFASQKPSLVTRTIIPGSDLLTLRKDFQDSRQESELMESLDAVYPSIPQMKALLAGPPEMRIAFLLPETYNLPADEPEYLVSQSLQLWWEKIGIVLEKKGLLDRSGELAVLASLVEKEARWNEERPVIAGVILNRLSKGMPLQIDATVVYAWKLKGLDIDRVLYKHLEIESEYNTYRYKGLPPSAICIPSRDSWMAAISPEKHDYLYYVANQDGHHLFSRNFTEHKKAIEKIRRNTKNANEN